MRVELFGAFPVHGCVSRNSPRHCQDAFLATTYYLLPTTYYVLLTYYLLTT